MDSVQVGREYDRTLHAISVATGEYPLPTSTKTKCPGLGGYRFSPNTSLSDALSIFVSVSDPRLVLLLTVSSGS